MTAVVEDVQVPNNLICNVQALGLDDCDLMLVSDGENWRCPYGHIQYRSDTGLMIRQIPDLRRQREREARIRTEAYL